MMNSHVWMQVHSAFACDLQQISQAVNYATEKSLVVIDEFGKGTNSADGAGLLSAVLGYFLSKGTTCPKVIASTHFHELITRGIITDEHRVRLLTTEIVNREFHERQSSSQEDDSVGIINEVVFLYRIVPGSGVGASYGVWCARAAGLPTNSISRAIQLSRDFARGQPFLPEWSDQDVQQFEVLDHWAKQFLDMSIEPDGMADCRRFMQRITDWTFT